MDQEPYADISLDDEHPHPVSILPSGVGTAAFKWGPFASYSYYKQFRTVNGGRQVPSHAPCAGQGRGLCK